MSADAELVHGGELDAALGRAERPPLDVVCETAFDSRITAYLDEHITGARFTEQCEAARTELLRGGKPFDEATATWVALRTIVGSALSFGMATGIEIARGRGWNG